MSPSTEITCDQLKEIIDHEKNTGKCASEVQQQVEDGKDVLDQPNTSSVQDTAFNTINNEFEHKFLD